MANKRGRTPGPSAPGRTQYRPTPSTQQRARMQTVATANRTVRGQNRPPQPRQAAVRRERPAQSAASAGQRTKNQPRVNRQTRSGMQTRPSGAVRQSTSGARRMAAPSRPRPPRPAARRAPQRSQQSQNQKNDGKIIPFELFARRPSGTYFYDYLTN